ncbi:MAG: hypothetical protein GC168_12560 [Candidatus Hydrogenedens sp.]|nr:hypothetical protein [Candidatus Hydrogenedens sp.]
MMSNQLQVRRPLNAPIWVHALALGGFAMVTLVWIIAYYTYRETDVWAVWLNSDGPSRWPNGTETHFNERIFPASIFRTPSNTFSNLGYVFVGLYVLAYSLWDFRRPTAPTDPYAIRTPWLIAFFGFYCVGLGFGSGFMHASLTGIGGWWDVYFMFGSLVAMIALHWGRIIPEISLGTFRFPTWPLLIAIAIPVSYVVKESHGRFSDIQIMTGLIGTIISSFLVDFVLRQRRIQHRWHILSILAFFLAFGIWNLTNANRFTSHEAMIQGHAIWHVLTACSLGFMAILYRTEVPVASAESEDGVVGGMVPSAARID